MLSNRTWALAFFVLMMTDPRPAQAQTVVAFQLMPPGHDGQVQGVGRARYYLLDEYLQLAQFDAELVKLRADVQDLTEVAAGLKRALDAKDTIIVALQADKKILADRCLRLEGSLNTCEKKLVECEGGTIWPYIVGAAGVVAGAVGLGFYLGTK
jgi:hypothetical protein